MPASAQLGTLLGGLLSDKLSARTGDRRWYMWVPGIATLVMVPFQFFAYLSNNLSLGHPVVLHHDLARVDVLRAVVRGVADPGDAALASCGDVAAAAGADAGWPGPRAARRGRGSARCSSRQVGEDSLRYGLCLVGLVNLWAAFHYFVGARSIRAELREHRAAEPRAAQTDLTPPLQLSVRCRKAAGEQPTRSLKNREK